MNAFTQIDEQIIKPMLLTARQAAKTLTISERKLWTLTRQGKIPVVRIDRCVRYDLADLRAWINRIKIPEKSLDIVNTDK